MIGSLHGKLLHKQPPMLVLDVGGVGFEVEAPMSTFFALPVIGEAVTLQTHLAVRDDALLLFGFATIAEKTLFRELVKISGVGAKLALTILSGSSVSDFIATIQTGDTARLTALPGIGKKTAQRLLLEMRDRFADGAAGISLSQTHGPMPTDAASEAHNALTALGYKQAEATRLLKGLEADESETLIRQALQRAVR